MIPTTSELRIAQAIQTGHQFDIIEQRLQHIQNKIAKQREICRIEDGGDNVLGTNGKEWNWANSYQQWSNWEDIDELSAKKEYEQSKLQSLIDKQSVMQHYHDHSKEKEFFDLPEDVKIKKCNDYRILGNYLFDQGVYSKAAERYQIAIAYYEYCFPSDPKIQHELDFTRYACLCNVSLCFIRLGHYRKAIESANQVLRECKNHHAKALFRRAQAYRLLDEYENSRADLEAALEICPGDSAIIEELLIVQSLSKAYKHNQRLSNNTGDRSTASSTFQNGNRKSKFSIANSAIALEPILPKPFYGLHECWTGLASLQADSNCFK